MRHLTIDDVEENVRVVYAGEDDGNDVLDPARRAMGHVLKRGHPGLLRGVDDRQHVTVAFLGLEDEPASWAVGFGYDAATGIYPGLLLPDAAVWAQSAKEGWWAEVSGNA